MHNVHDIFVILNYISVFVMLISYMIITRQTASRMQKLAMVVTFSLFICCIGFLFRIEAQSVEGLILGQKLIYSFVTFGMFYMLLFILEYCEYKINKTVTAIFNCINGVITVAVLTLDHHQLFYKSYWLVQDGDTVSLEKEYGILHTVAILLFALYMAAALVITVIYSVHNIKCRNRYVWRLWLAVVLPCASYVVPKLLDMQNDLQPMAFAAFTVVVLYMIYKNNLYDVDNIAAQLTVQTMGEAIIVIDGRSRLQGCNQLAKDLFPELKGINLDESIKGQSTILDDITKGKAEDIHIDEKIYEVTVSPVNNADNRLIGKVIRLKDETIERKYTELLKAQQASLTSQVETLSNISYKDDLTGCANRRSYKEAVNTIRDTGTSKDVTVWAVDLNGLKEINDAKGHAAGDEIIKAACRILTDVFVNGTVYRTGGDEFFVITKDSDAKNEAITNDIKEACKAWNGSLTDEIHLAYGYVDGKDYPELSIDEIMILADKRMYDNKRMYYETAGIDRRNRQIGNKCNMSMRTETAIIHALSDDFECVSYVALNDDKYEDVIIPFRTSEKLLNTIPNWNKERNFHNRLQLLTDSMGAANEIKRFVSETRREVIISNLESHGVYYINFRAALKDEQRQFYQIKFVADRDDLNQISGLVVGMRNIDNEMRHELDYRAKAEELVLSQTRELKQKNDVLSQVNGKMISMIGEIVEWRDSESGEHIDRVKRLTGILGRQVMKDCPEYSLSIADVTAIANVAPLHDVGKIRISDSILLKPGKLNPEEFEIMKTHCVKGCEILKSMYGNWSDNLSKLSMDICMYHHEKWDGRGYPEGLKGDEIPIAAQIVSLADAYDALVSERPYKKPFSHDEAYRMIVDGECGKYSDKLLACLQNCREQFAESENECTDTVSKPEHDYHGTVDGKYISGAMPLIEAISESMPGGFFIYQADSDEKLIYFNDLMIEYFGCSSREDFILYTGNTFKGIVHPDDYEKIHSSIYSQVDADYYNLDHVVYRIRRKDGSIGVLDDYGRFMRTEDMGEVFIVFVNDISGQTKVQQSLGEIYGRQN